MATNDISNKQEGKKGESINKENEMTENEEGIDVNKIRWKIDRHIAELTIEMEEEKKSNKGNDDDDNGWTDIELPFG